MGEDLTDAAGEFNVWFDSSAVELEKSSDPDVYVLVKNSQNVVIHETDVDSDITGSPHGCPRYFPHKGAEYEIEVDYVTVLLNSVGPVDAASIDGSGYASWDGISDRPFGGITSIGGRIWGAKVDHWKLYYAEGFLDSSDLDLDDLDDLHEIARGDNKVWDGLIHRWHTGDLEGHYTAVLVVWDEDDNAYHDTQFLFLHNTAITPPAEISSPPAGSTLSKGATAEIEGTAWDDYFLMYLLYWVGPTQTELTSSGIEYPPAGNDTAIVDGKLGEWSVSSLPEGPYCLRLTVVDRTIFNDGFYNRKDWTWNTLTLTA